MRRGCISLGQVECDDCHRIIPYPERYLAIDEAKGATLCLCIDCSLKRGYACYKVDRGESVLTFLEE
ncbi:hypothetical protein ES702_04631 [subsurface metagenome]